jgi:hypothetical protein
MPWARVMAWEVAEGVSLEMGYTGCVVHKPGQFSCAENVVDAWPWDADIYEGHP